MLDFDLRPLSPADQGWVADFMTKHWGAEIVVAHGQSYHPAQLPGFAACQGSTPVGLVTYHIQGQDCEIVTLDSLLQGAGIGSALIDAVKSEARHNHCCRLWLITTNDNLNALRFYQKRGFELVKINRGAVNLARKIKPSIPLIGLDGIPIRDEIELEMPV